MVLGGGDELLSGLLFLAAAPKMDQIGPWQLPSPGYHRETDSVIVVIAMYFFLGEGRGSIPDPPSQGW